MLPSERFLILWWLAYHRPCEQSSSGPYLFQMYQNRKCLKFPGFLFHLSEGVHPDRLGKRGRCVDRIMRKIVQLVSRSDTIQLVRGRVPSRQKQGENLSENFTKISASQLPAWKTITFWNIIRARPKKHFVRE